VKVNTFGRESVRANRKDGLAVKRLRKLGIDVVITTMETNDVVIIRAKKMRVEALRGLEDKVQAISEYINKQNLSWSDVWYVGNDVNDLGAIEKAKEILDNVQSPLEKAYKEALNIQEIVKIR
jgi:N-acylneuraminate cytidylyltransferase